jgi:hypothetical protein
MIRIFQVKCESQDELEQAILHKLNMKKEDLLSWKIHRKSVDARKQKVLFSFIVDAKVRHEKKYLKHRDVQPKPDERFIFEPGGTKPLHGRPVVVGFGPAGMFASLLLAQYGYKPLILERGSKIDKRTKDVERFWHEGVLDPKSNVQFGEGGAGAFSDGKLTTRSKDPLGRKVLEELVNFGANKDILIEQHPHIGTDAFVKIIENMRHEIERLGGEFYFDTALEDIVVQDETLKKIILSSGKEIDCSALILACGHSADDTIRMLHARGLYMENKPFAVGVRIEHTQKFINEAMLHEFAQDERLIPARYSLTCRTSQNKGVYTFCMCPGGYVINASSQPGALAVNGMSYADRGNENANAALLVQIDERDYGTELFAGLDYQRALEEKAYALAGGNGAIPVQKAKDYLQNKPSSEFGQVKSSLIGPTAFKDLNELFSSPVNEALHEALEQFEKTIPGYVQSDALLSGVESRSSSAIKMVRDPQSRMNNIYGLFACGEGAGYAGGIMTSAIDGLHAAMALMSVFDRNDLHQYNKTGQKRNEPF